MHYKKCSIFTNTFCPLTFIFLFVSAGKFCPICIPNGHPNVFFESLIIFLFVGTHLLDKMIICTSHMCYPINVLTCYPNMTAVHNPIHIFQVPFLDCPQNVGGILPSGQKYSHDHFKLELIYCYIKQH